MAKLKSSSKEWLDITLSVVTYRPILTASGRMSKALDSYIRSLCSALLKRDGYQAVLRISKTSREEEHFLLEGSLLVDGREVVLLKETTDS